MGISSSHRRWPPTLSTKQICECCLWRIPGAYMSQCFALALFPEVYAGLMQKKALGWLGRSKKPSPTRVPSGLWHWRFPRPSLRRHSLPPDVRRPASVVQPMMQANTGYQCPSDAVEVIRGHFCLSAPSSQQKTACRPIFRTHSDGAPRSVP